MYVQQHNSTYFEGVWLAIVETLGQRITHPFLRNKTEIDVRLGNCHEFRQDYKSVTFLEDIIDNLNF